MTMTRVAITIDSRLVDELDALIRAGAWVSRSQVVESAVIDKLQRLKRTRLARESAKLNPVEERALAEEWHFGSGRNVLP